MKKGLTSIVTSNLECECFIHQILTKKYKSALMHHKLSQELLASILEKKSTGVCVVTFVTTRINCEMIRDTSLVVIFIVRCENSRWVASGSGAR